jgi:Pyruvate/2-oxoacid:ferredoxin oxidoreductase delta subunit
MDVYEELRIHLDKHPTGAPDEPEINEILSTLFTADEARVASNTPFLLKTAAVIAERAGVPEDDAVALLESMADKGMVFARDKNGERRYALMPIMPGIFEIPYMKGEKDASLERLAELWDTYLLKHAKEMCGAGPSAARVVAVQEEVENQPQVLTYEMINELIDGAKSVGLAHCACRTAFENCDRPREACMLFDETCDFLVERGYARYLTKDEMKKMLVEFEEMGLVHNVNNTQDRLQFICNCCSCCCGFLRIMKEYGKPSVLATSGFLAEVDADLCSGCAVCEERCPMDAIEIVDDLAVIDAERCIGCALCVSGCDTDAIEMLRREELPETPDSLPVLGLKVLEARGKVDEFLEVNM